MTTPQKKRKSNEEKGESIDGATGGPYWATAQSSEIAKK
jgi:hypothetical protein